MTYRIIKNLKRQVGHTLKFFPETRNRDIGLMIKVWQVYYPSLLKQSTIDHKEYVKLDNLYELPREDNIKRIRASYQSKGKFLPTEEAVAKQRKLNMDEWRVAMGYPTKESTGTSKPSWTPKSETASML